MKKHLRQYLISWVALVALFNIICFVTPSELYGFNKYGGSFWSGYGFIQASFVLHLLFIYYMFSKYENEHKTVSNQMITVSFAEIFVMVLVGTFCMVYPNLPNWVGIIACSIILAFSIVILSSTKTVGETTVNANIKLNERTEYFRDLVDEANILVSKANNESKELANKVFEALRYSDPTSTIETQQEEQEIKIKLSELSNIINNSSKDILNNKTNELINLIEVRNNKCKQVKRQGR